MVSHAPVSSCACAFAFVPRMGLLTQALASSSSTAVVVGSSQGIGLAFVNALLHRGRGRVIAATRRPAASPALASLAQARPERCAASAF